MIALRRHFGLLLPIVVLSLLMFAPRADAAWGDLDTSFAAPNGFTKVLPAGNGYGTSRDILLQPDGKVVVAGSAGADFFTKTAMLQRFMPDGTPDPTFGAGGTSLLAAPASPTHTVISGIAMDGAGNIVCVATGTGFARLFRVTSAGALDTTFAAPTGYVGLTNETLDDVIVHTSGDIYVSGTNTTGRPTLRRFNSSGVEIGTFRTTSSSNLSTTALVDFQPTALLQSGNDLVLMATGGTDSDNVFLAAKLDTTGSLVNSWGTNGRTVVTFSTSSSPEAMLLQPSGAIVMGGNTQVMGDSAWTLARLTPGGTLDPTFAGGGKQELNYTAGSDGISGLASAPDGGFVAIGGIDPTLNGYVGTVRMMTADGVAQTGFGPDGTRTFTMDRSVNLSRGVVQSDGKVVATGSQQGPPPNQITSPLTIRFQNNPPVLTTKVSSPKGQKIAAKKLKKFSGTATVANGTIAKIEIALRRVDSKLLKRKKQCLWLSSSKIKFKKTKAVSKKCSTPKWLKASGTTKWTYKLSKKLPKGSYVLQVRAKATDGTVQTTPTTKKFKVT